MLIEAITIIRLSIGAMGLWLNTERVVIRFLSASKITPINGVHITPALNLLPGSLFSTGERNHAYVRTTPSLRKKIVSYVEGVVSSERGVATNPDGRGHFLYFLFDPVRNNPVSDFHFVIE